MQLGSFSLNLAVKNLEASRQFYEKLGFTNFGGDPARHWLILKNGDLVIGLFEGMFQRNARCEVREGSRREHHGPRELPHRRPGREPDPVRPARVMRTALT